jgi:hypothetical protein
MNKKLTLSIDETVIEEAKSYAKEHKKSLSSIIEDYLSKIMIANKIKSIDEIEISPIVSNLSNGNSIADDFDYKEDYINYLERKYQ